MIWRSTVRLAFVAALICVLPAIWSGAFPAAAHPIEEFHAFLLPDTIFAAPGDTISIRFEVDSTARQFNGYGIKIHCDPGLVTPDTVFEGSSMIAACANRFRSFSKTDSTASYTHVLLCSGLKLDGPAHLSTFRFAIDSVGASELTLVSDPNMSFYDAGQYVAPSHPTYPRQVIFHNAWIIALDPTSGAPGGTLLPSSPEIRLYPNPVKNGDRIHLVLPDGCPQAVDILDLQGRRRWEWTGQAASAAPGVFVLPRLDPRTLSLPTGFYVCRVRSGNSERSARFLLLR